MVEALDEAERAERAWSQGRLRARRKTPERRVPAHRREAARGGVRGRAPRANHALL